MIEILNSIISLVTFLLTLFKLLLLNVLLYDFKALRGDSITSFWLGTGIDGELVCITVEDFFPLLFLLRQNIFKLDYCFS